MKVHRNKTEYMCVDVSEAGGKVQGAEVVKVNEFKYLGSTTESNRQ